MKDVYQKYEILIIIVFAAFIGGGVGAFSKIGLRTFEPLTFLLLRFVAAATVLLPIVLYRERKRFFNLSKLNLLFFVSLLGTLNVTIFIFGIRHTTATISQMLYAATPLLSALIIFFLFKDRLGPKKEFGLVVGFLGVLLIIFLPAIGKNITYNGTLLGNILIFSAVVCVSFYLTLSKNLQKYYNPIVITTALVLITIIVQFLLLIITGNKIVFPTNVSAEGLAAVGYTGILGTGLYYLIYQYAIKKASPTIASLTMYLQPIFGAIWAMVLLGEKLTVGFLFGALLTLTGVYIVSNTK